MGWREKVGKLLAGETVSLKISPSVGGAGNRLTAETDSYAGQWRGANSALRIKADGTIDYRRQETVGDTTNTEAVIGSDRLLRRPELPGRSPREEQAIRGDRAAARGRRREHLVTVNGERLERAEPTI